MAEKKKGNKAKSPKEAEFRASFRFARISPKKATLVARLVRGKNVNRALETLQFVNKRAVYMIEELIRSCMSNATQSPGIKADTLKIKEIRVDAGPALKRWRPRSRGMAHPIKRRTCHISLVLSPETPEK